jgi:hypothetical protein
VPCRAIHPSPLTELVDYVASPNGALRDAYLTCDRAVVKTTRDEALHNGELLCWSHLFAPSAAVSNPT